MASTTTAEYKKAQRLHLKSTRGRNPDVEKDWTAFRAAEKRFKARFPPVDLSDVLDLALLDEKRTSEIAASGWSGSKDSAEFREISSDIAAFTITDIPGLIVLPSFITHGQQRDLIVRSLRDQARSPNPTNLDTHYNIPSSGLWNTFIAKTASVIYPRSEEQVDATPESAGSRKLVENAPADIQNFTTIYNTPKPDAPPSSTAQPAEPSILLTKLRWANIGWFYHWGTKQYDFKRGKAPIDKQLRALCQSAVAAVNWHDVFGSDELDWPESEDNWRDWSETYEPDAGIVNFYQTKDTLMAHVDRSEVCATSPLVSISLGNAAVFLIGGQTRDVPPIPILLRSGDVVIMSGPICRRAYHGVPRILENSLPSHLSSGASQEEWEPYGNYMHKCRMNINVRQVFPKHFDPNALLNGS